MKKFNNLKSWASAAVLTTLLLISCSQTEALDDITNSQKETTPTAVQFGTYLSGGENTRAGVTGAITNESLTTTEGDLRQAGFGVFAYNTGTTDWNSAKSTAKPNFMYNQRVATYSYGEATPAYQSNFYYSPIKYWPNDFANGAVDNQTSPAQGSENGGKVSFFAYAPYVEVVQDGTPSNEAKPSSATDGITAITGNDASGEPKVKYVLNSNNFVDLLWGIRTKSQYDLAAGIDGTHSEEGITYYNTDLTKQKVGETVKFTFKHALAQIGGGADGLQVVLDIDDGTDAKGWTKAPATLVTIEKIEINTPNVDGLKKEGWFNIADGTWTVDSDAPIQTMSSIEIQGDQLNTDIKENATNLNYVSTSGSEQWQNGTGDSQTKKEGVPVAPNSPTNVYGSESTPSPLFVIPGDNQKINVTVKYIVRTYDANLNSSASSGEGTWTKVTQTITNAVNLSRLESNKIYKLVMHLGLTSVKFSAVVTNWDAAGSGTDASINLPSNVVTAGS
ncbi:MAG: hypothetical protein IJV33_05680 [Bacteroidaceae bacterium]|nr:hypothetical protein [Bacteroidaceae bacterium]